MVLTREQFKAVVRNFFRFTHRRVDGVPFIVSPFNFQDALLALENIRIPEAQKREILNIMRSLNPTYTPQNPAVYARRLERLPAQLDSALARISAILETSGATFKEKNMALLIDVAKAQAAKAIQSSIKKKALAISTGGAIFIRDKIRNATTALFQIILGKLDDSENVKDLVNTTNITIPELSITKDFKNISMKDIIKLNEEPENIDPSTYINRVGDKIQLFETSDGGIGAVNLGNAEHLRLRELITKDPDMTYLEWMSSFFDALSDRQRKIIQDDAQRIKQQTQEEIDRIIETQDETPIKVGFESLSVEAPIERNVEGLPDEIIDVLEEKKISDIDIDMPPKRARSASAGGRTTEAETATQRITRLKNTLEDAKLKITQDPRFTPTLNKKLGRQQQEVTKKITADESESSILLAIENFNEKAEQLLAGQAPAMAEAEAEADLPPPPKTTRATLDPLVEGIAPRITPIPARQPDLAIPADVLKTQKLLQQASGVALPPSPRGDVEDQIKPQLLSLFRARADIPAQTQAEIFASSTAFKDNNSAAGLTSGVGGGGIFSQMGAIAPSTSSADVAREVTQSLRQISEDEKIRKGIPVNNKSINNINNDMDVFDIFGGVRMKGGPSIAEQKEILTQQEPEVVRQVKQTARQRKEDLSIKKREIMDKSLNSLDKKIKF